MLDKSKVLFDRDEAGELIPKVVKLEGTGDEIRMIPLKRGEWLRIQEEAKGGETGKDQDKEIILKNCVEPKFSEVEVDNMKPAYSQIIALTILKNSGLSLGKVQESDELKK